MASLNKVIILGNLTKDPQLRNTQSGTAVTTLDVATSERYKDSQGNWQEKPEYHRVNVWGKQAENCCKFLSKGRQILVEGAIQTRKWQDKQGNNQYSTEIVAKNTTFIGKKEDGQQQQQPAEDSSSWAGSETPGCDDIPF